MGTAYTDKTYRWNQEITQWRFFRHLGLCYKIIGWLLAQQQILELFSGLLSQSIARPASSCLDSQYPPAG